jgi:hypothetical protein
MSGLSSQNANIGRFDYFELQSTLMPSLSLSSFSLLPDLSAFPANLHLATKRSSDEKPWKLWKLSEKQVKQMQQMKQTNHLKQSCV